MKKLKFMLAAATAIGLASALQADDPQLAGSTDFEDYEIGAVTGATDTTFFHLPNSAEEGDYQIVAGVPDISRPNNLPSWFTRGRNQVLQLEGGTDPLERYAYEGGGLVDLSAASVYVDTLVQFTVTPAGDTVTAQTGDKLMIYLQQVTNGVGEVTGTNLVAKAGYMSQGSTVAGGKDYVLTVGSGTQIYAGQWYRLTVKAIKDVSGSVTEGEGCLGFTIAVDGEACTADSGPFLDTDTPSQEAFVDDKYFDDIADGKVLISILGFSGVAADQKLKSVGFAGSGFVDDLVFTTLDPEVTFISFTLAYVYTGGAFASAPTYTCGELTGEVGTDPTTIWFAAGSDIEVSYTPSASYNYTWATTGEGTLVVKGTGAAAGTDTITPVAGGTATLSAEAAVTTVDFTFAGTHVNGVIYTTGDGSPLYTNLMTTTSVNAGTVLYIEGFLFDPWYVTASDSDVKAGDQITISATTNITVTADIVTDGTVPAGTTLADVGIDSSTGLVDADLPKVAAWAHTYGGGDTAASLATVNTMSFVAGVPQNEASEAYLLNCAVANLATAKADFKFTSFDPANPPTAADFASKGYNGTVTIKAASTLANGGDWDNMPVGVYAHFFKAVLTK